MRLSPTLIIGLILVGVEEVSINKKNTIEIMDKDLDIQIVEALRAYLASGVD